MAGCASTPPEALRRKPKRSPAPNETGCAHRRRTASLLLSRRFSMSIARLQKEMLTNLPFYEERVDLACAFRWTARLNMHEAVANHFSLAVNDDGSQFLM